MEEPNGLIRCVIYVFSSGTGGLCGMLSIALLLMLGILRFPLEKVRRFVFVVVAISALLMTCGSIPLPGWFFIGASVWMILLGWIWLTSRQTPQARLSQLGSRLVLFGAFGWFVIGVLMEAPLHRWQPPDQFRPAPKEVGTPLESPTPRGAIPAADSTLMVIGDSVTAGLNDREDTWPRQLSREWNVNVVDASQPGATLKSARKQNLQFGSRSGLVILEIGGNNLLEGLPADQFEQDLDELLSDVLRPPGRKAILFELPLPPFHARYGSAQRRQARRHDVVLVPKRMFAQLLTSQGATVDGIHLSKQGQTHMKSLIELLLRSHLNRGLGTYEHLE
jgi:acyl-CoA thioesterase-1